MNCINYKSKEYKSLLKQTGLSRLLLNARILNYQSTNNTDVYPTLKDVSPIVEISNKPDYIPERLLSADIVDSFGSDTTLTNILEKISNVKLKKSQKVTLNSIKNVLADSGVDLQVLIGDTLSDPIIIDVVPDELLGKWDSNKDYYGVVFTGKNGKRIITLNKNNLSVETILHEALHPFTTLILKKDLIFAKTINDIYLNYKSLQDKHNGSYQYGLTNPEEFVSEILSKTDFAAHLKYLVYKDKSILQRVLEVLKRFINKYAGSSFTVDSTKEIEDLQRYLLDLLVNQESLVDLDYGYKGLSFKKDLSNNTDDFKKVFSTQNSNITFISEGHLYINEDGTQRTSVSNVSKISGYSEDFINKTERGGLASPVGTGIHAYVKTLLTGEALPASEYFPMTKNAENALKSVIKDLIPNGVEILGVEQVVGFDPKMYAGTLDLLVKLSDGTVRIIDLKTKITKAAFLRDSDKNPWLSYEKTYLNSKTKDIGKSQRIKHDFQQTSYRVMLEQLGLRVDEKGIVPLEVSLVSDKNSPTGYVIDDVFVTKALSKISSDKTNGSGFFRLYDNYNVIRDVNTAFGLTESLNQEELIKIQELDRLDQIAKNGLDLLKKRAAKYIMIGQDVLGSILERDVLIAESLSNAETLFSIVQSSVKELKPMVKTYNELIRREHEEGTANWNLKILQQWHDYAEAYSVLDDIKAFIHEFPKSMMGLPSIELSDFTQLVDDAIGYRDLISGALEIKGRPVWENWISLYSDSVDASYRRTAELEFKNTIWDGKRWDSDTEKDLQNYINQHMLKYRDVIEAERKKFVRKNADMCFQDIDGFSKYVSSIFDTKDPIIGAMAKSYYDAMQDSRQTWVYWYQELVDITEEFEKKYKPGSFTDNKKLYDYMLDYDEDGAKLVTQRTRKFDRDYHNIQTEARTNQAMTENERFKYVSDWLNKNAPIPDQNKLLEDLRDYYKKLYHDDVITEDEYNVLLNNELDESPRSVKQLGYSGDIRLDIIDNVILERSQIIWEHRSVDKNKYPNPKYDKLQTTDKNSIEYRMYQFFIDMSKRGDAGVANRFKLKFNLPGMSKSLAERVIAGENAIKAVGTEIKHSSFNLRPDDVGYGQYVFADEGNQQIDFVPIYFTNRLSDKEQSYDLPTIYKEWFKSSLNYQMVTDLLPMLEYTKRVVHDRKVLEKNKSGKPIKNMLSRLWTNRNPDSEAIDDYVDAKTNHLAEMLDAWLKQVIFDKTDNLNVTHSKVLKLLTQYTSLKVMGVNLYSMINNASMAELNQAVEVLSNSVMSPKAYTFATKEYAKELPSIVGDVGARKPNSKVNLLNEFFGVFQDTGEGRLRDRSLSKRLFYSSALYFTTNVGEHMMQSRFMIGVLSDIEVFDKDGKSLGSAYSNYTVVDGKLAFNPLAVKLADGSAWDKSEISKVRRRLNSTLRSMHGNYAQFSKVMIQQNGYSALALQFRKWIVPGWERRWRNEYYDEFASTYKEGYFKSGGRFYSSQVRLGYYNVAKFFGKLSDEAKMLDLISKTDYRRLTKTQQEGIRRFSADMSFFIALTGIIMALGWDDDDKDSKIRRADIFKQDDSFRKFAMNHIFYQVYRLRTEQLFFINPLDFVKILKSPVAATSSLTDMAKLIDQTMPWNVDETYRSGQHKGRNKWLVMVLKQSPVVRQLLRWMDPVTQKKALDLTY